MPWLEAQKSEPFVEMASGSQAELETRVSVLWDDEALYVGFWVQEPHLKARLTERDACIFQEHDVEVFIDGGDCYYEFEVNARNTVYEVLFIWRDSFGPGSRFDLGEFDVFKRKALTFAGDYDRRPESFWWGTHPRGPRWAFLDWDFPGMESAVWVDGLLNSDEVSKGWRAEVRFPWSGMGLLAGGRPVPPRDGDEWRMFFGRFQPWRGRPVAWCHSRHGVMDTHQPERFSRVVFRG